MTELTDDQINQHVATWMEWHVFHDGPEGGYIGLHPKQHQPDDAPVSLPDYVHDLNAVAECEARLTDDQAYAYQEEICDSQPEGVTGISCYVLHASARQRCVALLRVVKPELFQ